MAKKGKRQRLTPEQRDNLKMLVFQVMVKVYEEKKKPPTWVADFFPEMFVKQATAPFTSLANRGKIIHKGMDESFPASN